MGRNELTKAVAIPDRSRGKTGGMSVDFPPAEIGGQSRGGSVGPRNRVHTAGARRNRAMSPADDSGFEQTVRECAWATACIPIILRARRADGGSTAPLAR